MATFITLLTLIPALTTAIVALVKAFETPGNGAAKKQAVLESLGSGWDIFEAIVGDTPVTREHVMDLASKIIDVVVTFFNVVGIFKHKEA